MIVRPLIVATRTVVTLIAAIAVVAVGFAIAIIALAVVALLAGLLARTDRFALGTEIVVRVIVIAVVERVVRLLAARLVVLEPAALFAQHAEIMVRELQIIFDVDPVARLLRIAGQVLVLFVKLRRVAARAAVDAVAVVATLATALARIASAAIAATIIVAPRDRDGGRLADY